MNSTKVKALIFVFALLLLTSFVTIGCKSKKESAWVNTNSMPGHTFNDHAPSNAKTNNSKIVYLGSQDDTTNINFGPRDVSFDFKSLK